MIYKQTFKGPDGVMLHIDHGDVDTPAMVELKVGRKSYTATYYCALDTGELDCGAGPDLTPEQLRWLAEYETQVDEAFNIARKGDPRYG